MDTHTHTRTRTHKCMHARILESALSKAHIGHIRLSLPSQRHPSVSSVRAIRLVGLPSRGHPSNPFVFAIRQGDILQVQSKALSSIIINRHTAYNFITQSISDYKICPSCPPPLHVRARAHTHTHTHTHRFLLYTHTHTHTNTPHPAYINTTPLSLAIESISLDSKQKKNIARLIHSPLKTN